MSGLRFLGPCECKLSSHTKDQSWTNQKKKNMLVGVFCKTWNSKLMVGWN